MSDDFFEEIVNHFFGIHQQAHDTNSSFRYVRSRYFGVCAGIFAICSKITFVWY
jgi:hypothetical protein